MVIPLTDCVARPDEGDARHLLIDHLISVAHAAGSPTGSTYERLGFLAGLLHDAAKCHEEWQDYIQPSSARKKGPPHSPMGAALFAFVAEQLLKLWHSDRKELQAARDRMLNWLMAINGHHGRLGDFGGQLIPWTKVGNQYSVKGLIAGCDLEGVFSLVSGYFPEFTCDPSEFESWLENYDRNWLKLVETNRPKQLERAQPNELAMRYPLDFSCLIIADRIHAGRIPDEILQPQDIDSAIHVHRAYCDQQASEALSKNASPEMVSLRTDIQQESLGNYQQSRDGKFYTLLLPTGYGKTLTSLRIALDACKSANRRRIIYVAPYLSILSQATAEIREATGIEVFQHHHLSLAASVSGDVELTKRDQTDSDDDFEVLDTWKTPILATTFNQFFRALFPSRAQQTLRIDAVKGSFVIIDEPQIIDVNVWNVFLRALSVFAMHHDCQVLFTTATLPPLRLGLETDVTPLAPNVQSQHRYDIEYSDEPHDANSLANKVANTLREIPSAAVVLNTVRDAANVFEKIKCLCDEGTRVFCLTAMMLPSHKQRTIKQIGEFLNRQREKTEKAKLIVVCTQMLEAGVDLSFRRIWRARSVLPSIAQVAGRGNRHGEGERAKVFVFPFHSRDDSELRRWVYRDPTARNVTDSIFASHSLIPETEMRQRLDDYYDECWAKNSQLALTTKLFTSASLGEWSALAGIEPFGFSPPREEVFVPVPFSELDDHGRALVRRFAPDASQLLERYQDPAYRKALSFRDRKLFQIAVQLFVVPTRIDIAERIATKLNDWLWGINRLNDYSNETGLAHWLVGEENENPGQSANPIL